MVSFDAVTIIITVSVVAVLYIISRMFRRKVTSAREIEKTEQEIKDEEDLLKKYFLKKKIEMKDLRRAIERSDQKAISAGCSRIKAVIEEQEKVLDEIASLDLKQVRHLKHIRIDTKDMEGKKLSDLIRRIEKEWGRPGSDREKSERYMDLAKKDSLERGVGYLAMNFLHLHELYGRLMKILKEELKILSDNVDINKLETLASKEAYEIDLMRSCTLNIRAYAAQLEDLGLEPADGPFLEVTGHPVDVIISTKSAGMEHKGRGDRIDLALLPERVMFGSDNHKCSIVMNHDTAAVAATLVRHRKGMCAFQKEGGKAVPLSDGADFEAALGYSFRFSKK